MKGTGQFGGLRDRRRLFVGLAIAGVVVAGATGFLRSSAVKQSRAGAEARATSYVSQVVEPAFGDEKLSGVITGQLRDSLTARLQAEIFAVDEVVGRVRIWAPSGGLLFSTDATDRAGQTKSTNLDAVKTAVKGDAEVTATLASGPEPRLTVFAPLRFSGPPVGAVEIDDNFAMIEANAGKPWGMARTAGLVIAGLFGVLTLVSFAPTGRSRAPQVPGRAFLDEEDRPQPPPGPDDREWERMRSKLEKSEQGRKALETELEQLRLQISNGRDESTVRMRELEEQLDAANSRVQEVTATTPVSEHKTRIQELESALAEATARTQQVEAKALDLTSNVTHSESMALRMQAEAEEARRELSSVASRVAQANARVTEAELKATDAETAKAEMKARLDKLEEELRWSQAQQVETQPLLQEASGRLNDAKTRADEALARATKMEERALDAEAAATRLEERLALAEAKAAKADVGDHGAADGAGPSARIEELAAELASARAEAAAKTADLEQMLEASVTRGEQLASRASDLELRLEGSADATRHAVSVADGAAAELATAQAKLAELESKLQDAEAPTQGVSADRIETDPGADARLTEAETKAAEAEARAVEAEAKVADAEAKAKAAEAKAKATETKAKAAEAKAKAAKAEAKAAQTGGSDGSADQSPELDALRAEVDRLTGELARTIENAHIAEEKGARLEAELIGMRRAAANGDDGSGGNGNGFHEHAAPPKPEPEESPSEEPVEEPWESAEPSLRSRLARTAARKKGRSRGEDGSPWPS